MRPHSDRLAVRRQSGERVLSWGLVIPSGEDHGTAHVGVVLEAGPGRRVREALLPMECGAGDIVLYSSRVDSFVLGDGSQLDIVEEASVIGIL